MIMKKIFLRFTILTSLTLAVLSPVGVFAATAPTDSEADKSKTVVELINPIGGTDANKVGQIDLKLIVGGILKTFLGILGSLALLVFVYGGFMWVTAAGNAEHVTKGADAMQWAAIGICIIFSSYAIIDLIFQGLGAAVSTQKSFEQKPGQIWCRDTDLNLCLAMKSSQCAAESFPTLEECEGENVAYEGGWCVFPDPNGSAACIEKLKSNCPPTSFGQTLDECESLMTAPYIPPESK